MKSIKRIMSLVLSFVLIVSTVLGVMPSQKAEAALPTSLEWLNNPDWSHINATQVTDSGFSLSTATSVSSDGNVIVLPFASTFSYYKADTNLVVKNAFNSVNGATVSGDGTKIAYNTSSQIWMIDVGSSSPIRVSVTGDTIPNASFKLNKDGSKVAYSLAAANSLKVVDTATQTQVSPNFTVAGETIQSFLMSDNGDLIFVARTNASPWIFKLKRWNAGSGLTTMHNITVPSGSDSLYLIKSSIDGNRLFYSLTTTTPTTTYNYNVYDSTTNTNTTLNLGADIDLARLNYYNGYFSDDGRYFVLGVPINYLYDLSNGNRVLLAPGLGFGGKASSDLKTSFTNDSLTGALIKIDGTNLFSTAFPTTVPEQPKTFTYSRPTLKSNSVALSWGHVKGTDGYKLKRNGSLIATWSGTSLPSGGASGQWNYAYTLADFKDQDTFEIIPFNKFGDGPGKQLTLVPPNVPVALGNKLVNIGDCVLLGGRLWNVVGPNYLISKDVLTSMAYGASFDVANTGSVAYYLNNTLYNTFSEQDKSYVQYKMWTIYPDNSTTATTTIGANIGLLSSQEFKKIWNLPFVGTMPQWLLNPSTATVGSNIMTIATDSTTGNQSYSSAAQVRPTLYVKSGSVISSGNGSVGSPYIIGGVIAVSSPLALYQTSGTEDTISMSWSSVAGASGYKAYREDTLVYTGTDTNLGDTGLPASTAYTYSVKAFTGSIESNPTYGVGTTAAVGQTVPGSGTGGNGGNGSGGGTGGTPLSENNYLSNIVVSGVTLDKSFNKNILNYSSANDVSLNSIKIKATAEDSGSTIKLNGNIIASGVDSQSITLTGGANTFVITVTAASGATKNYSLTINKVLNTINDLSSIVVEGTSLNESFDKNILSYTADVPTGTTNTRITVGSYSIYSTIEINGIPVSQNIASSYLPLSIGDNTFNIEVTAQNGISKTYVVKVKRAGLSSNNNILSVFMGSAQLTPSFSPSVTEYATSVPQAESTISILAFKENDNATLKINNVPATSGVSFGPLPLQSGLNTFVISVKAQDGTTKNYTIRVTRGEVVSPLPDVSNPPAINFIATDITKTSVKLKWNPIANTDYYLVSRNGSAPSTVTGVTYFEDVNLSEDTDFTYTLIAKNQFGNSIPLTTVAHTLGSPPAKPTNFMATAVYFDSVAIQWDMVNKALTYAVTRNNMQKAYDGKLTVFRDQTVTASTYYDYSVQAKNAYGVSDAVYMRVWTPAAPVLAVSEPVIAKGKVFFEFEIIENASEYHINRNPHWGYIKNAAGTYDVSYDNAVTGETKSMGTVALNGNKLPFYEEGLDAGDYAYKIKALVTNPDGSTSTTPEIDVNTTVTEGAMTPPGTGTPGTGTPETGAPGTGTGNGGSGGSSGGSYGGGGGGGSAPISVIEDVPVYDPNASPAGIKGYGSSVGLIPFTDVLPTSGKFSDIADHWCRECIEKLITLNVVNGKTDTLFSPESKVTRAEFTAMVVRALNLQEEAAEQVFHDVTVDNWFSSVINIAAKYKIVEGVEDTKFDPNALVTRQEMATILSRVLIKYKSIQTLESNKAIEILNKFVDSGEISEWAFTPSAVLVNSNIINGKTDTHFVPKDKGTRAESAKLICGVLNVITQK